MSRRLVVLAVITSLFCGTLGASQASNAPAAATWVVGARPFVLTASRFQDATSLTELTTSIPALILEHLADVGVRVLPPEELLQRQLKDLYKQRTTLANSLSNAVKERDRQLFLSSKEKTVMRNLKEKEREVAKIRGQLEELDQEIGKVRLLVKDMDYSGIEERQETVALWQNDPKKLFQPEKVTNEVINGLLTGEIAVSGNYLSVRVQLTLYPGKLQVIEVRSAASVADVSTMSRELAQQLAPVLQNRPTVLVTFDITPPEAEKKARIMVDGQVFQPRNFHEGEILLPAGNHRIVVESDGFRARSFTGEFSGDDKFLVNVMLAVAESRPVELVSKESQEGSVYINGFPEGGFSQEMELPTGLVFGTVLPTPLPKPESEAAWNEKQGKSEASSESADSTGLEDFTESEDSMDLAADAEQQGEPADSSTPASPTDSGVANPYYFVADVQPGSELLQLNVRLKRDTEEISSRIEKRRRVMYNSYSALLVSLIPSFVSYGMYVNMSNGLALGHESEETVKMWKNISTGSMILSAGLGLNFAVQMGFFLGAADSVLPERAKSQ
ncbi:MAG: hypothetical protein J6C11_03995 [Spirochaetaceae bacterium]|nr:hypothetical protein [Spirochaetaceae bacterium]